MSLLLTNDIFSVSPEFWLYWAVTLPLATMVMVIWRCWLWVYQRRKLREFKATEEAAGLGPTSSYERIVLRRSSVDKPPAGDLEGPTEAGRRAIMSRRSNFAEPARSTGVKFPSQPKSRA